ncbi:MAG: acyl-CoA dehydratase activase [Intestinimonas sp.]|jgi:predicted CoA-substrate-specific enzyme activase|nr:acyl-CoA dehydratase activase [Intestinimonas sp.]
MITMGVDVGSTTSKAVILQDGNKTLSKLLIPLGTGTEGPARVYKEILAKAGLSRSQVDFLVATGYGRLTFPEADAQISEVSCHGRGMHFLMPSSRTIIDIGGQDAKVLSINETGGLIDFVMNDKCAAGTGRFLDVMARVLNVEVKDLSTLSERAEHEVSISSVCTVFAESEVISQLAAGHSAGDIVAGIHRSVAKRVSSLALRLNIQDDIAMSGGVALNRGVVRAIQKELNRPVYTVEDAQLAGAYGAAILAYEKHI